MSSAALLRARIESSLGESFSSTLLLRERPALLTVPIGVAALDTLTGGLPRGALTEIVGPPSSGRTSVMLTALAGATRRQETCALVDASDSFDPAAAAVAGVDLERLLWVRCSEQSTPASAKRRGKQKTLGRLEQVLKITDLLLQGGGFGMVVLDLGDISSQSARCIPLTSWFRFRRTVEPTATVLLLVEQEACAKTCASLVVRLERTATCACNSAPVSPKRDDAAACNLASRDDAAVPANNVVSHAALLKGMRLRAEVLRSWTRRKPMQSVAANFKLQTA
jgi:hypothetical protein